MARREDLLGRLDELVARRRMSRRDRLLSHPLATVFNSAAMRMFNLLFALGRPSRKTAATFFGDSMTVVVPSGYGDVYCYGATVCSDAEVRLNKFLLRELAEGGVFFDVGACLGYYSLLAAHLVGPNGQVHAFEPSPPLIALLRRNLGGRPNVRVFNKAMSKSAGSAQFYVAPLPFIGTASLRSDWAERNKELVTVETTCLDDHCWSTGVFPDIIKLDVEGVEDDVLKGASKLLAEKAPIFAIELFTPLLESDRKTIQILKDAGYEPYAIQDDGRLKALDDASMEPYLADLRARYRIIQDSVNDFDNVVFKRRP